MVESFYNSSFFFLIYWVTLTTFLTELSDMRYCSNIWLFAHHLSIKRCCNCVSTATIELNEFDNLQSVIMKIRIALSKLKYDPDKLYQK